MQNLSATSAGTITIADKTVSRLGLGTNRITSRSKDILEYAVKLGIQFFDTANAYTNGQSEETIGETLSLYTDIVIATKGGMHPPDFHIDSKPQSLGKQLEESLKRLRTNTIQLYFLHRVDPRVPFKESILFLKDMQDEGKIRHIGLSEVNVKQLEEARKYVDIVAVENQYSIAERKHEDALSYCEKENITFVPFYPLHTGTVFNHNGVQALFKKYNASETQLALAWLLQKSKIMLPIPGTLSKQHLEENVTATSIRFTEEEMQLLQVLA